MIAPVSQRDTEKEVDRPAELDPNYGKSKGDIKKEAIATGANHTPHPSDNIGKKYPVTPHPPEEKKELPFCAKVVRGTPCREMPICTGNGGAEGNAHVPGENCRPAGFQPHAAERHLPPKLQSF